MNQTLDPFTHLEGLALDPVLSKNVSLVLVLAPHKSKSGNPVPGSVLYKKKLVCGSSSEKQTWFGLVLTNQN
jgi:hypothetical protein